MSTLKQDFSHVRVLVVEDNMINQLLVMNLLKRFGFTQLDAAENGKEALRKLEGGTYDLVLMDIQMPGMDGYEVTKAMRSNGNEKLHHIPVIALTGDASEKEKAKAAEAGMNDYVAKPYSPEELLRVIMQFVQPAGSPASSSSIDMVKLEQFTGGDKAFTIQLIEIFLEQVPQSVDAIEKFLPERRWEEIFPVAHKIKSSFAVFGMEDLRACIEAIENYTRDQQHLDEIPGLFSKYKAGCLNATAALNSELLKLRETG